MQIRHEAGGVRVGQGRRRGETRPRPRVQQGRGHAERVVAAVGGPAVGGRDGGPGARGQRGRPASSGDAWADACGGVPNMPLASSRQLVAEWEGAELIETSGLGHTRIMYRPDLAARMAAFIAEG